MFAAIREPAREQRIGRRKFRRIGDAATCLRDGGIQVALRREGRAKVEARRHEAWIDGERATKVVCRARRPPQRKQRAASIVPQRRRSRRLNQRQRGVEPGKRQFRQTARQRDGRSQVQSRCVAALGRGLGQPVGERSGVLSPPRRPRVANVLRQGFSARREGSSGDAHDCPVRVVGKLTAVHSTVSTQ
ncbi:hypothetical protein [Paraburkholderia tuberum]|uniref:hypothetical protein n=1 Tax=Paraburkholderia tuberum TaxID=157910 RepID=UPI00115FC67C|nr:hypothetical protein [Paraburkholderia tuberum]